MYLLFEKCQKSKYNAHFRDLLPGSYTEKHFDERGKSVVTKPHIYTQVRRTHTLNLDSIIIAPFLKHMQRIVNLSDICSENCLHISTCRYIYPWQ